MIQRSVARFLVNESGAYGPILALMLVPLIGTAALAVDYSNASRADFQLQAALDASALATAKELASSTDQAYLSQYARSYFKANLNSNIDSSKVTFSFSYNQPPSGGTTITLDAQYEYDTYLARAIDHDSFTIGVTTTIAAGNRTAEIAIVVDNSGSMNTTTSGTSMTRLEAAQQAAVNLVNSLHTVSQFSNKPDPIQIAVVPFAGSVNVGRQFRGADWLDMNGWSSVHHENLDWLGTSTNGDAWPGANSLSDGFKSTSTTTSSIGPNPPDPLPAGISEYNSSWLTRWTLFDALSTDWKGCVEMRPGNYHATDAAPDSLDADTLFVPMFAPDEPDYLGSGEDNDYRNNYLADYRRTGPDYAYYYNTYGSYGEQYDRMKWAAKYNTNAIWSASEASVYHRDLLEAQRSSDFGNWGPNQGCTTMPITELSDSPTSVNAAIAAMQAGGYTNVQAGVAWGWRVLSPGEPFTSGRAYTVPENDKYLIILTDGNNTFPNQSTRNETEYYAWGYGRENRVKEGLSGWYSNTAAMDAQTAATCNNIKAITDAENEPAYRIFTIAYDVPNGSSVKTLLYDCASTNKKGEKYYYDVQGTAIADAMAAIGNEISQLRISR